MNWLARIHAWLTAPVPHPEPTEPVQNKAASKAARKLAKARTRHSKPFITDIPVARKEPPSNLLAKLDAASKPASQIITENVRTLKVKR